MSDDELRPYYKNQFSRIKQNYYIGVHFGWLQTQEFNSQFVDFAMAGESTLPKLQESIFRIPLNSRNFISREFRNNKVDKIWDIITVGRNVRFKNYNLLFSEIKKLLKQRSHTTILMIIPSQTKMMFGVYKSMVSDFYDTFSFQEQKQITFLFLHPELDLGLNQSNLVEFYNRSSIFTLFSTQEGESRVISEALCCGLGVVVYSDLAGGGRDLLTKDNSLMFSDFNNAHTVFDQAIEKFKHGIRDKPHELTREDHTIDKLDGYFQQLFTNNKVDFSGGLVNTDHLDLRLPAHYSYLPWKLDKKKPTADILSKQQFNVLLEHLF